MRPRQLRRRLILAGFGAVLAGATIGTGMARADGNISSVEAAYINAKGETICQLLDEMPTPAGLLAIGAVLIGEGFAGDSAADIINVSVAVYCPQYGDLLQRVGDSARGTSTSAREML